MGHPERPVIPLLVDEPGDDTTRVFRAWALRRAERCRLAQDRRIRSSIAKWSLRCFCFPTPRWSDSSNTLNSVTALRDRRLAKARLGRHSAVVHDTLPNGDLFTAAEPT